MRHFLCPEGFNLAPFWALFLCSFTGLLLLDVDLSGLILTHRLTVIWTTLCAFVLDLGVHLRRSQGIACDGLVWRFDEPMRRLLCGLPAASSA